MAIKQLYATGAFKYQHRMLQAGDPVQMDGPTARLYEHLGKVSETKPRVTRTAAAPPAASTVPAKPKAKRTRRKK